MNIALSTSQNCGISYFVFDDIASLAGSANARDVDPQILSDICKGLRDENPYCVELRFLGAEARERAEGIIVVPRMTNQPTHFDVCSVMNNRQTGEMKLHNGKPTNPNTQQIIEYSPQIRNAHANTMIFDSPHNWL